MYAYSLKTINTANLQLGAFWCTSPRAPVYRHPLGEERQHYPHLRSPRGGPSPRTCPIPTPAGWRQSPSQIRVNRSLRCPYGFALSLSTTNNPWCSFGHVSPFFLTLASLTWHHGFAIDLGSLGRKGQSVARGAVPECTIAPRWTVRFGQWAFGLVPAFGC